MTKMNKYHVKFTHQYARPQDSTVNTSSAIQYITETVDTEWELDAWIDVFTYIYTHYEVIGCVEVIHLNTIKELEKNLLIKRNDENGKKVVELGKWNTPKRAAMKNYNGNWNWEYECPVCKMNLLAGESYCSSCGQK